MLATVQVQGQLKDRAQTIHSPSQRLLQIFSYNTWDPWTYSYSAQIGGSSRRALPFVLVLPTRTNTTEGAFLKSVLCRRPAPQMDTWTKSFTLQISITSPTLEFLGEETKCLYQLHNQFNFHAQLVYSLKKEDYYFSTSNSIFVQPNILTSLGFLGKKGTYVSFPSNSTARNIA